jgi:hypothetical protein
MVDRRVGWTMAQRAGGLSVSRRSSAASERAMSMIKPLRKVVLRDPKPDNLLHELERDRLLREHLEREERRMIAARVAAEWMLDI